MQARSQEHLRGPRRGQLAGRGSSGPVPRVPCGSWMSCRRKRGAPWSAKTEELSTEWCSPSSSKCWARPDTYARAEASWTRTRAEASGAASIARPAICPLIARSGAGSWKTSAGPTIRSIPEPRYSREQSTDAPTTVSGYAAAAGSMGSEASYHCPRLPRE